MSLSIDILMTQGPLKSPGKPSCSLQVMECTEPNARRKARMELSGLHKKGHSGRPVSGEARSPEGEWGDHETSGHSV